MISPIGTKFGMMTHTELLTLQTVSAVKILNFLKSKIAGGSYLQIFKKLKSSYLL